MVGRAVAGYALWLAVVPSALVAPAAGARHTGVTVDEEGVIHQRAGADEFDLELLQAGAFGRRTVVSPTLFLMQAKAVAVVASPHWHARSSGRAGRRDELPHSLRRAHEFLSLSSYSLSLPPSLPPSLSLSLKADKKRP